MQLAAPGRARCARRGLVSLRYRLARGRLSSGIPAVGCFRGGTDTTGSVFTAIPPLSQGYRHFASVITLAKWRYPFENSTSLAKQSAMPALRVCPAPYPPCKIARAPARGERFSFENAALLAKAPERSPDRPRSMVELPQEGVRRSRAFPAGSFRNTWRHQARPARRIWRIPRSCARPVRGRCAPGPGFTAVAPPVPAGPADEESAKRGILCRRTPLWPEINTGKIVGENPGSPKC